QLILELQEQHGARYLQNTALTTPWNMIFCCISKNSMRRRIVQELQPNYFCYNHHNDEENEDASEGTCSVDSESSTCQKTMKTKASYLIWVSG
ncbi:Hypothetical predicted protein, partial [Mytilus galloprovincialis]